MKSAVQIGSMFFQSPEADEAERFLAENGLDAMEISLPINADAIRAGERRRIIECARRLPGRVALHEVIPLALAHRQSEFRRRLTIRLAEDVRLAREAGISILTLHTTCTRTVRPLEREWRISHTRWLSRALDRDVTASYEESVRAMIALLEELSPTAAEAPKVWLAVENNFRDTRFFGRRMDSVDDVLQALDAARPDAVGLYAPPRESRANAGHVPSAALGVTSSPAAMCFDIFKAFSTEQSIPDAIRRAGGRIVNVHASDAQPADTAFFRRRAAIGQGAIGWRPVAQALAAIGYRGPIIFEMMEDAEEIRSSALCLREIFAELE